MWRAFVLAVPLLLLVFLVLGVAAAWSYPGGTWADPTAQGHSFFGNYFCDLMRPTALNGQPNPGAGLAELAQLIFAASLLPLFLVAPRAFPDRPTMGRAVRVLGTLASLAGVAVVLFPSWKVGQTGHGILLLICAGPALTALGLTMACTWRVKLLRSLALALMGALMLTLGIFVRQMIIGTETTVGLPVLQRVDFALALSWMCLIARAGA